ncbi:unnamed protein product [Clonostachys solani]|uniref:DUF6546 domain-containing protein n=1 Tax=Clonostachys solani TaxID=160281 RepID=A0A9N9ZGI4_9HYPO|nr:unnamed protein product [Clonostachys solani]
MASWTSLPTEIKWMIFELLVVSKDRQYEPAKQRSRRREMTIGNSQGAYASVSNEWRLFFERSNFGKLILHQDDVETFGRLVQNTQRPLFVKWVWLRVELPLYNCAKCHLPESVEEDKNIEFTFTNATWRLLEILSEFDATHSGITLELSADSPSLTDHYAQEYGSIMNDTSWHSLGAVHTHQPITDSIHGWEKGRRGPLMRDPRMRIFGHPRGLQFDKRSPVARRMRKLPKVPAVKALVVRLQCYRRFSVPKTLHPMLVSFTSLRDLTYESWKEGACQIDSSERDLRDIELEELFLSSLSSKYHKSLGRVSVYERSIRCPCIPACSWWIGSRESKAVAAALAIASNNMEELYINDSVDACHFFEAVKAQPKPRVVSDLKKLSLFAPRLWPEGFERQLKQAATVAYHMPHLREMELWNYDEERWRSIFRYRRSQDTHSIEFQNSWGGFLSPKLIEAWEVVARHHGSMRDIQVVQDNKFQFHGKIDAMAALKLAEGSLTDTSRRQILGQSGYISLQGA